MPDLPVFIQLLYIIIQKVVVRVLALLVPTSFNIDICLVINNLCAFFLFEYYVIHMDRPNSTLAYNVIVV